ncbi:hypothetical protein B9P52_31830 [Achromobacter denitrificans]|uniref:phage tail protein n=1 Tax=Achromobacter denitrificans TaxID=32002 RepID=UPI000B4CA838|nr:phage tail protein [Achromobacter denitrificans]ASC68587.1 hypothetical protein B9P52_31830 [Achromobacter denitrificans]
MGRLLTLRRNLARLLTRDEVDDNFVNVVTDFSGAEDPASLAGAFVLPFMRWADTGTGWLKRRNAANDGWVEVARLLRRTVQPFDASETPTSDIGPIWLNGQGMAEWEVSKGSYSVRSELPVGKVDWCPLRAAVWAGWIPGDGQTVSRATFPDLAQAVIDGRVPVVSEAEWQAEPLKRGAYTLGDGSTTIRVPDYNGKSAGSLGAIFLRGDGLLSAETNGLIQRDALQNITATISSRSGPIVGGSGAVQVTAGGGAAGVTPTPSSGTPQNADTTTFDASRVARTATETRPLAVSGCFVIKAFGAVVNPGSVDAAQLATDYAVLNAAVQTAQGQISKAFGVGQQWYTYTAAERGGSNTYVNSTPQPILVKYTGTSTAAGNLAMVLDGENYLRIFWDSSNVGAGIGATMLVPPGGNYSVGGASFNRGTWSEYRGYR